MKHPTLSSFKFEKFLIYTIHVYAIYENVFSPLLARLIFVHKVRFNYHCKCFPDKWGSTGILLNPIYYHCNALMDRIMCSTQHLQVWQDIHVRVLRGTLEKSVQMCSYLVTWPVSMEVFVMYNSKVYLFSQFLANRMHKCMFSRTRVYLLSVTANFPPLIILINVPVKWYLSEAPI